MNITLTVPDEFLNAIAPDDFKTWLSQAMRPPYIRYKRGLIDNSAAEAALADKETALKAATTARVAAETALDDVVETALESVKSG